MEHGRIRLAPTSLAQAGMTADPLLETCLAALRLAAASDTAFMDALFLSTYTFRPPYEFLTMPVGLPEPNMADWRTRPVGVTTLGMDSTPGLAREYAKTVGVDLACAKAMVVSRALRVAQEHPVQWRYAVAQTQETTVSGLHPNPLWGWCSTLAGHGRGSGPLACAVAASIRDGRWGARRAVSVDGLAVGIPLKTWMGLEASTGVITFPFDETCDGEPDF